MRTNIVLDDELLAKSPRVKDFFCVVSSKGHVPTWDEVSEDKLVDAEYKAYVRESVEHIKNHYKYKLDGIIEEALKQGREEVVIRISNLT